MEYGKLDVLPIRASVLEVAQAHYWGQNKRETISGYATKTTEIIIHMQAPVESIVVAKWKVRIKFFPYINHFFAL